jgi:hypothetical protein
MKMVQSFLTRIPCNYLIIAMALLMLSACNPREDKLSEREALISARESELVTLFAELVEQRKELEKNQSDTLTRIKGNANNTDTYPCATGDAATKEQSAPPDSKTILGEIEYVYLDPPGLEFTARIDTGAQTSSLNALDIVEFERDGKPFVKFNIIHPGTGEKIEVTRRLRHYVRIKERGDRESQRRPVVRMRVALADINEQINFTLIDRGRHIHQVLIGRNLLRDLAIVDVSKKFTTIKTDN